MGPPRPSCSAAMSYTASAPACTSSRDRYCSGGPRPDPTNLHGSAPPVKLAVILPAFFALSGPLLVDPQSRGAAILITTSCASKYSETDLPSTP
jgi:hypothetical protein